MSDLVIDERSLRVIAAALMLPLDAGETTVQRAMHLTNRIVNAVDHALAVEARELKEKRLKSPEWRLFYTLLGCGSMNIGGMWFLANNTHRCEVRVQVPDAGWSHVVYYFTNEDAAVYSDGFDQGFTQALLALVEKHPMISASGPHSAMRVRAAVMGEAAAALLEPMILPTDVTS